MERIGRYVIFDPIASGGMASVHLGRMVGPLGFARTVAVKRLHRHLASDSEFAVMLLDEARVTGRIQHPFVVQTLDVVSENGELLIVMEYVHGTSLARLRKLAADQKEKVDPSVAAAIMINVLTGLHAAHEATDETGAPLGLVHRDVSPQNILVGTDGIAKVLDFGVAKALGRAQTTREGQVKGKLAYMAPEQMRSRSVDRRTDVFAASIVFWEMLTSKRLFAGTEDETIGKVIACEVSPPSQIEGVSASSLDAIVLKGLAKDPADRFATALEMAQAIENEFTCATPSKIAAWVDRLAQDELASRRALIAEIERADSTGTTTTGIASPFNAEDNITQSAAVAHVDVTPKSQTARRSSFAAPLVFLAVALAGGGGWFIARRSPQPSSSADLASAGATQLTPDPVPSASATPSAVASDVAHIPATGAPPSASVSPPLPTAKKKITAPHVAPAATVDCTDPYVLDSQGRKRYRRECLGK